MFDMVHHKRTFNLADIGNNGQFAGNKTAEIFRAPYHNFQDIIKNAARYIRFNHFIQLCYLF